MTLYVVQARGTDEAALVRARFLAEGFSWPAFVFAQLWLLYHRLWLALVPWIVVEVAFVLVVLPHVSGWTAAAVDILARIFLALEGNRLRQNKGARRAGLVELVEARDRDEAEAIFYRRRRPGPSVAAREVVTREPVARARDEGSDAGVPGTGT